MKRVGMPGIVGAGFNPAPTIPGIPTLPSTLYAELRFSSLPPLRLRIRRLLYRDRSHRPANLTVLSNDYHVYLDGGAPYLHAWKCHVWLLGACLAAFLSCCHLLSFEVVMACF